MPSLKLVIGNKNYSTWSLRSWLLLKYFDINFEEQQISLETVNLSNHLLKFSPSKRVPVVIDSSNDTTIWDSLAICEYINDFYLKARGWPSTMADRALARAVSCEMHAGFAELRNSMPMNIRAKRKIEFDNALIADLKRIDQIWSAAKGDWLFKDFSIADCMLAPIAFRLETYSYDLSSNAENYRQRLLKLPAMQLWRQQALQETEIVTVDETGEATG